jgi:protein involved in polysaccharide export with SLBB domain/capsular polysaccharide biosynthesis protein
MKENFDAHARAPGGRDDSAKAAEAPLNGTGSPGNVRSRGSSPTVDIWVALDVLARRWHWLILGGCLFAGGFFYLGLEFIKPKFTAVAQLRRSEPQVMNEALKAPPLSPETFSGLIRSPALLTRVGNQVTPSIPPERLVKMIKIDPEADSDFVKLSLAAPEPHLAVDLLNIYAREAAAFTKEFQTNQIARLANDFLNREVSQMKQEASTLEDQFRKLNAPAQITNKLSEIHSVLTGMGTNLDAGRARMLLASQTQRLKKAMADLDELREKYTDIHPLVTAKSNEVSDIQNRIQAVSTNLAGNATSSTGADFPSDSLSATGQSGPRAYDPESDIIRIKLTSLEDAKRKLLNLQTEADSIATNPSGLAEVFAPASMKTVQKGMLGVKIGAVSLFGALLGMGASLLLVLLVELKDRRLRNSDDVRRVTKLPILTSLGDLDRMDDGERRQWAFRTWTMLQGRLSPTANHGLVCGVTSCSAGEGRSTWIHMLAEAASLTGFRVLTISTKPTAPLANGEEGHDQLTDLDPEADAHSEDETAEAAAAKNTTGQTENGANGSALARSVLSTPSQVTDKLTGPNPQPMVHIPLPGWVWNLERRKQWREAITQWRSIDNLVILVELPPASVAEAVLLGCNLPNLLWLSECGKADAAETRTQLETLRNARCNLVGAVLNREPSIPFRKRFPRWLDGVAAVLLLTLGSLNAQQPGNAAGESPTRLAAAAAVPDTDSSSSADATTTSTRTNVGYSITNPSQRAAWQQHLTLGAGDVLNFGIYGQPDLTRTEVSVTPDGTVTYLQAENIPVSGLSIDELRERLDKELGQWYRSPRTIVTPVTFRSKRYYMLGKVMTKGVYVLDRPITVLEAIARAHGLENGLVDRNVIDLADFQRAFLMREGKRYPLNFEKLFQEGDLAQNIPIEPGDYIYFPSTSVKEVYVVGEVRLPGTATWNPGTTIMAAISARGGYTDRAYKMRVLVVRGSLNNPEKIVVNTHAILDGEQPDFKLEPKDIIYVNSRPFIKVEEIADMAATAFIQSLITTWVGVDVVKPINP